MHPSGERCCMLRKCLTADCLVPMDTERCCITPRSIAVITTTVAASEAVSIDGRRNGGTGLQKKDMAHLLKCTK